MTSGGPCTDPGSRPDLAPPAVRTPLCYRGGSVIHKNETFALTWDPDARYWAQTRGYVEQFLRDVADASGSLGSPFAVTHSTTTAAGAR